MKKIAIIGSGSFLARNFIKYSLEYRLDYKFELYDYCEINEWSGIRFTKVDFNNVEDIKKINFDVNAILVFIGKTGTVTGFERYKEFIEVNEIMLLNILHQYVLSNSTAKIIYPSSRLVFESNKLKKIKEDDLRKCKSIYAVTKQAAENYLEIYKSSFGLRYVVLRICTPIGTLLEDFGNYGTFEIFKKQAVEEQQITIFGDGLQRKTFTRIEDICKAFSLLIEKEKVLFNDYNLGGQELSLLDIAEQIASEYNVPVKFMPWPVIDKNVDGGTIVFDSTRFDKEFKMTYLNIV